MERFNKNNIQVGEIVQLDASFTNCSTVQVVHITSNGIFSEVKSVGNDDSKSWLTMTNRLTKIIKNEE